LLFETEHLEAAGSALSMAGRPDLGLKFLHEAVGRKWNGINLANMAAAHRMLDQLDKAETRIRQAIKVEPTANRWMCLACIVRQDDRIGESEDIARMIMRTFPTFAEAPSALAGWLIERWLKFDGDGSELLDEALTAAEAAIAAEPKQVDYQACRLSILNLMRRYERWAEDAAFFQRHYPGHYAIGMQCAMALLHRGDLANGWPMMARYADRSPRLLGLGLLGSPEWTPQSPPGDVDVVLAHGVGDTIQYARYFKIAASFGARLNVVARPHERRLLERCPGVAKVIRAEDACAGRHTTGLGLIAHFTNSEQSIPRCPYLTADPDLGWDWHKRMRAFKGRIVGVAWTGSAAFDDNDRRSFKIADLAPLFDVPGITLVSLQHGGRDDVIGTPIHDLGDEFHVDDFAVKAAVIANVDLVISCDSSMNHLAGALGVPSWLALNVASYYLWGSDRDRTPWYPSVRIWRQTVPGRWSDVFGAMAKELHDDHRGDFAGRAVRQDHDLGDQTRHDRRLCQSGKRPD
jgi:hypothetical protein